jgi:hypothetical protein
VLSLRESDFAPMPADGFTEVTIPLYYEGHVYRAGSRIRVTIAAPGGTQPIWAFAEAEPEGTADVAISHGGDMPSHLLLPVVPGVEAPTELPPCPGLRGEPCRDYQAFTNRLADTDTRTSTDGGEPAGGGESPATQGGSTANGGGSPSLLATGGTAQHRKRAKKCRARHRKRHHGKTRCHRKRTRR